MNEKKNIAVLGSTGSIGVRALNIISSFSNRFNLTLISCNSNHKGFVDQILKFNPEHAVINSEIGYLNVKKSISHSSTRIDCGEVVLCDLLDKKKIDIVLVAIVGFAALKPTISAIMARKQIALASKETLVVAGEYVMGLAKRFGTKIIPVDSEHSAIFQCLQGEKTNNINKILLTASGGPFRGMKKKQLLDVTRERALKHPNWKMGEKITIDSATLMNKGFELIEARWLFDLPKEKIKILVHPESIIHSLVEFCDSSIIAQMGLPSMDVPILYALSFPNRLISDFKTLDLVKIKKLHFEEPDIKTFRHLQFAYRAVEAGGSLGCVLNAANEIAVNAFLEKKISFLDMQKIVEKSMENITFVAKPTIEDLFIIDKETRRFSKSIL